MSLAFAWPLALGTTMPLETLIAVGVFGWLIIGVILMGLGVW